jgi:hypothetical protein
MKVLSINEINYNVPTCWEDVTIAQFCILQKLRRSYDGLKLYEQVLFQMVGIPEEIVDEASAHLIFVTLPILQFLATLPEKTNNPEIGFTFNDVKYFLKDIENTKFEMWIDYEQFLKKYKYNTEEDNSEWMPYIIAVLVQRFDGEEVNILKTAEEFKKLPMSIAFGLAAFFLHNILQRSLLIQSCTLASLMIQNEVESLESSLSTTVGGTWSTHFVKRMLLKWIKCYKPQLLQFSTSLRTELENQR